jgi:hypothetical protein
MRLLKRRCREDTGPPPEYGHRGMTAASQPIPPGYILISLTDLAALMRERAAVPAPSQPEPADGATWEAIAAAVGLVCAQIWRPDVGHADIIGDVPAGTVVHALTIISAALVRGAFADHGTVLLRHLGELAGTQGRPPQEG